MVTKTLTDFVKRGRNDILAQGFIGMKDCGNSSLPKTSCIFNGSCVKTNNNKTHQTLAAKQHFISEKPCISLTLLETIFKPPKCIAKAKVD